MKLLLDENLPQRLRHCLPGHDVATVHFMGWKGVENGALLRLAAAHGFDVLLTKDSGMKYQLNPASLPVAVVIINASTNTYDDIEPLLPLLLGSLSTLTPRTLIRIGGPVNRAR
jgi:predicted nuclease of predicted toxin-antitoxin system